jgi:Phytanoyl-CoA dioxygenase (PhyH)
MHRTPQPWAAYIENLGFALVPGVFSAAAMENVARDISAALATELADGSTIYGGSGTVYASRNVLMLWPPAGQAWRQPPLPSILSAMLGQEYGLVRALYFDKPPDQTWALPWHKDLTIAVRDNQVQSSHFRKPTTKAGVPHIEAPVDVLRTMLTCRIHLDEVTEENGPLKVIPGSHRTGKTLALEADPPETILSRQGDVLLMRPLLAHCSNRSHPDTRQHRRILHLEFAGSPRLPDRFLWHDFIPGNRR